MQTRNRVGETPLALAAQKCHLDVMRFLIDKGADVDAQENAGRPLMLLTSFWPFDPPERQIAAMRMLIEVREVTHVLAPDGLPAGVGHHQGGGSRWLTFGRAEHANLFPRPVTSYASGRTLQPCITQGQ